MTEKKTITLSERMDKTGTLHTTIDGKLSSYIFHFGMTGHLFGNAPVISHKTVLHNDGSIEAIHVYDVTDINTKLWITAEITDARVSKPEGWNKFMSGAGRPQLPPRTPFEAHLRDLMVSAGISSYAALADKADIATSTIQEICSGKKEISLPTAQKLAVALNTTLDALLNTPPPSK